MRPSGKTFKKNPNKVPKTGELSFGQLITTRDSSLLKPGDLSVAFNLWRDEGTPKLDWRYRVWGTSVNTSSTYVGAQISTFNTCDRLVIIRQNGGNYEFYSADLASSLGSATSVFGSAIASQSGTGEWVGWQHLNKVYFANVSDGRVRALYDLCSTPAVETLFKTSPFGSGQFTSSVLQDTISDYAVTFATYGTDTIGSDRANITTNLGSGQVVRWTSATAIIDFDDTEDDLTIEGGRLCVILDAEVDNAEYANDFAYIYQTSQDWRGVSMLTVKWGITDEETPGNCTFTGIADDEFKMYLQINGSATWVELEQLDIERVSGSLVYATFYARTMSESDRQTVKKVRFYSKTKKNGGAGYEANMYVDLWKGGETYLIQNETADRLSSATTPQRSVKYWVRYRSADGLLVSRALPTTVDYAYHQGFSVYTGLPKMGTTIRVSALVAGSPWGATSLVDIYREVEDQSAGGAKKWFRIVEGSANTATVTFDDFYTDKDLLDSATIPALTSFDFGGSSLGGSDPVTDVICGASYKGSNVLGTDEGLVLYSRTGTHDDFAWPGADYPFDPDNLSDPGTYQVSSNKMPIIAIVASDSVYLFASDALYGQVGDYPNRMTAPTRIPDASGLISKFGACRAEGGAIYASRSGLYYVEIPFSVGESAEPKLIELTKDIRPTWAWLIGSTPELTSVSYRDGDLRVTNGKRYIRKTREGMFTSGENADNETVFWQSQHYKYLNIGLTSKGRAITWGAYKTDGGTDLTGSNGTAASWSLTTSTEFDFARITRGQLELKSPNSASSATFSVTTDRGSWSISYTGASSPFNKTFLKDGVPPSGRRFEFSISGNGDTEVRKAMFEFVDFDKRRGK